MRQVDVLSFVDVQSEVPDIPQLVRELGQKAQAASRTLASLNTARKDAVLSRVADALEEPTGAAHVAILEANAADVIAAREAGASRAMIDRLTLDGPRLVGVARAVRNIVALPDPIGSVRETRRLANGLEVGRMKVPLGVIAMIYESRPNVTAEAAALCLKSGNAVLLRGGKEAFRTSSALARVFAGALDAEGLPPAAVTLLPTTDREATLALIGLSGIVDLVIPRGGESLIRFVTEHAKVPVIQHYKGVCHVYVDGDADHEMAIAIALDAKVRRPGVCNAMETLLVDAACAETFVPKVVRALADAGVALRGDDRVCALAPGCAAATAEDWDTEYLDLVASVAVVDGIDGALAHVAAHGTRHTEAIVTRDLGRAERWVREVDASLVAVNASTRFNDGGALGLGAEIGISTTKLHAYGPMGLSELCAEKWVAHGNGQIRG